LNEDEVMDRYAGLAAKPAASAAVQKGEKPKPPAAPQQQAIEPEGRPQRSWEPYLWGGIAVIAVSALLLIMVPGRHPEGDRPMTASHPVASTAVVTAPAATTAPEKLYLDIIALDDVWVLVRTDSSPQKKAVLKKGESITWSADSRFLVSNGRELTVTGPKNAVVRDLIITSAGVAFQKFEAEKPMPAKPKVVTKPAATVQPQLPALPEPQTSPVPSAPRAEATQTAPKPPQHSFVSPLESILSR
jgi:hypothetical protein